MLGNIAILIELLLELFSLMHDSIRDRSNESRRLEFLKHLPLSGPLH